MQNAEMEFVVFDAQDVIATSGELTVTLDNFGDGTTSNGTFTYGGNLFTVGSGAVNDLVTGLRTYFNLGTGDLSDETYFYKSEKDSLSLKDLNINDTSQSRESKAAGYDGVYVWISESKIFRRQ